MTCSSVTHSSRNVKITPLHTGQALKQPIYIPVYFVLFQKSLCDVMVISGEVVALQHQLQVSDMMIDMLPQIKLKFHPLTCPKVQG